MAATSVNSPSSAQTPPSQVSSVGSPQVPVSPALKRDGSEKKIKPYSLPLSDRAHSTDSPGPPPRPTTQPGQGPGQRHGLGTIPSAPKRPPKLKVSI